MGNPNVKECRQCKHHCIVAPNGGCLHYCKKKKEYVAAYRIVKFYRDLRCKYFKMKTLEDDE